VPGIKPPGFGLYARLCQPFRSLSFPLLTHLLDCLSQLALTLRFQSLSRPHRRSFRLLLSLATHLALAGPICESFS